MKFLLLSDFVIVTLVQACGGSSGSSDSISSNSNDGTLLSSGFWLDQSSNPKLNVGEVFRFSHTTPVSEEKNYEIGLSYPDNVSCWPVRSGFECVLLEEESVYIKAFIRNPHNPGEMRTTKFRISGYKPLVTRSSR